MKNTQFGKVFVPASIRGMLRNECAVENSRRTGNLQAHGLKTGHNTARLTTVALVDVDRQTSHVAPVMDLRSMGIAVFSGEVIPLCRRLGSRVAALGA
jgi:hypothetical protein